MAMAYGLKSASLGGGDANRFFESFRINKNLPVMITAVKRFTDSAMALSIASGASLTMMKGKANAAADGWNMRTHAGLDAANSLYVMLSEQAVQPGYHMENDSAMTEARYLSLAGQYNAAKTPYVVDGYPALMVRGATKGAVMKALVFTRGNRSYMLCVPGDSNSIARQQADEIFRSLRLLPYRQPALSQQQNSTGHFSTMAPSRITWWHSKTISGADSYIAFNSNCSTGYSVSGDTLDKYAWYRNDSVFFASKLDNYYSKDKDEIIAASSVQNGADKGMEWIIRKANSHIYYRARVLRHENIIYNLFASGEQQVVAGNGSSRFFSGFRTLYPATRFDLSRPKTEALLTDIRSADSVGRGSAGSALRTAAFVRSDLPRLYQALFLSYRSLYSNDTVAQINGILADKIAVLADSGTLRFVRQAYPRLSGRDTAMRMVAALLLSHIKTAESYDLLAMLLNDYPFPVMPVFSLNYAMRDSLPLLKGTYREAGGTGSEIRGG